jgi:SAM-dependent methyltransferase
MTDHSPQPTDVYVFYGGVRGRERLRTLSNVMRPCTESFLDALAIEPTWRCLDAGCGGGDVTAELARRVPRGLVVGLDVDAEQLRIAADEVREAGVHNVELHVADLSSLPSTLAGFDLVYARFVLTHLPAPEAVLAALVDACRPGGVIALEDIDIEASLCDPPTAAFDTYLDWYCRAHRARGGDPGIGRRLVSMLIAAGVESVDGRVVQPAGTSGDVGLIAPLTAAASSASIVERGIATAAQVEELVRQLADLGERADTLVTMPRVIQAWGTRP